jgi:hypothetical protein
MKIGIIGTGDNRKSLLQKVAAAGHHVKGCQFARSCGRRGGYAQDWSAPCECAEDIERLILSVPLGRIPEVAPLVAGLPPELSSSTRPTVIRSAIGGSRLSKLYRSRACGSPVNKDGRSSRPVTRSDRTHPDAGGLADSRRQQPAAPCYRTDLTRNELPPALAPTVPLARAARPVHGRHHGAYGG